jgi:hypothetical protein
MVFSFFIRTDERRIERYIDAFMNKDKRKSFKNSTGHGNALEKRHGNLGKQQS